MEIREMTVYSSYHGVMKDLKESAEQNKYLSPPAQGAGGLQLPCLTCSTSQALPDQEHSNSLMLSHTAASSPKWRPLMQQQSNPARITKSSSRLVPCSPVSQADAPNFDCDPHLHDLLSTSPNCSEPFSRGKTPVWEPLAEASQRLHFLPCSAGAACHVSSSCRRNANLDVQSWQGRERITENRLPTFTFCLLTY